jgi:hypothetical protein
MASSALDLGESQSGQTKDYKIGICCFSAKHTALRTMSKDWLTRKQDNIFVVLGELGLNKNSTKCVGLVQNRPHHHHLIEN